MHAAYLRHIALFASLDTATLDRLASRFNAEYIGAGQTIFHQGEPGDKFYLIARGQVEVLVQSA